MEGRRTYSLASVKLEKLEAALKSLQQKGVGENNPVFSRLSLAKEILQKRRTDGSEEAMDVDHDTQKAEHMKSTTALPISEDERLQLRNQIHAFRLLSHHRPIPLEVVALSQSLNEEDMFTGNMNIPNVSVKPNIMELRRMRDLTIRGRICQKMQELSSMMPHTPHQLQFKAEIEQRALSLWPVLRRMRARLVASSHSDPSFSASRNALRRRKKDFERMRMELEKQQKQAEDEELKQKQRQRENFIREVVERAQTLQSSKLRSLQMRVSLRISAWHTRKRSEYERKKDAEEKRRIRMLREGDENEFKEWVERTKQRRLQELIKWAEGIYSEISARVMGAEADESEKAQKSEEGKEGKSLTSGEYYKRFHIKEETIKAQPTVLQGGQLRQYQIEGLQWLVSLYNNRVNGILADEMGLGKTIQVISLIAYLMVEKRNYGPHLIIAPLSTIDNWGIEFDLWLPSRMRVLKYVGDISNRLKMRERIGAGMANVVLTTYEFATRLKDSRFLRRINWDYIIVDEGHRIKNHECQLVKSLSGFSGRHRLLMTGTPLQNNIHELWALLHFLMPKVFDNLVNFDDWFNAPFQNAGEKLAEMNETETVYLIHSLHKVLRPFLLRREKRDVEQLPSKIEVILPCELSAMQEVLYEQIRKGAYVEQSGEFIRRRAVQSPVVQLRKVCSHPFLFYPHMAIGEDIGRASGKFAMLDNMLPKLHAAGHRILLFSQWTMTLDLLEKMLDFRGFGEQYLRIDGSTKVEDRVSIMKEFSRKGTPFFLFLMTTKAGGLGVNLQTADTVILFEMDWNPQNDMQAIARCHRIGQDKEVRVFTMITNTNFEEKLMQAVNLKRATDKSVIGAGGFDKVNKNRSEKDARRAIIDSLKVEQGILTEQKVPQGSGLNRILSRTDEEFEEFQQFDIQRRNRDALKWREMGYAEIPPTVYSRKEVPDWMETTEEQFEDMVRDDMERLGRGQRVREEKHYNYDLITDREFERMMLSGNNDLEAGIAQKKKKLEARETRKVSNKRPETEAASVQLTSADSVDNVLNVMQENMDRTIKLMKSKEEKGRSLAEFLCYYPDDEFQKKYPEAMTLLEVEEAVQMGKFSSYKEFKEVMLNMFKSFQAHFPERSQQGDDAIFLENLFDDEIEKYAEAESDEEPEDSDAESTDLESVGRIASTASLSDASYRRRKRGRKSFSSADLDSNSTPLPEPNNKRRRR